MAARVDTLQDVKPSLQNDWKSSTGLITDNTSQSTDPSEKSTTTSDGDKTEELNQTKRERWNKKIDFLIACTGYSIGLGNVWRFPYLCYKNGGGAFLLPYFISVFVVGIPLFFLEVSLGQLMSRGGIEAWNICPLLKGIGYSSIIIAFLINMYYNIVMAWTLFYLFASFTSTLPWSVCSGFWNTPNCDENTTDTVANHSRNLSLLATDPVTEYWERRVLGLSESIEDLGNLRWDLSLCLLLAWIIIFLCIFRGLKATSQVTYFTALSPYVLLIILLGRAVSLPGATTGLTYFISPNWTRLASYTVWSDAGTQIFFSYAISIGSLPALGSFNDFHHNSFRDCFLFAGINTLASMLSGCVIFATLGYMSYTTGVSIHSVADSGPGLAFVAYPKALSTLPVSPLWSVLFFVMLFLLGLDSQFVSVEGFVTALADIFPRLLNKLRNRQIFMLITCLLSFLIGLPMVTEGGMYIFQIFDFYIGSRIILVVAIFECIVVGYIYGARKYAEHLRLMFGYSFKLFVVVFWCLLSPAFSLILLVLSIYGFQSLSYKRQSTGEVYQYPIWTVVCGWTLASGCVMMIPLLAIWKILRAEGPFLERIQLLTKPHFSPEVYGRLETCASTTKDESEYYL